MARQCKGTRERNNKGRPPCEGRRPDGHLPARQGDERGRVEAGNARRHGNGAYKNNSGAHGLEQIKSGSPSWGIPAEA